MVFSSLLFLYIFFPLYLLAYFRAQNVRAKNTILIISSLIFYGWGEPICILLLLITVTTDFINGQMIARNRGTYKATLALIASLVIDLGLLCTFKYSGFLVSSINAITGLDIPVPQLGLPIGISFYTFQTLSYTIDVYRGKTKPQRSFPDFLLYVSLFYQLVAGPIVRYTDISKQLVHRETSPKQFSLGLERVIVGLAKKVLLANTAGQLASTYLNTGDPSTLPVLTAWFGIIMYTLQIYFDFSAYSDMAIGMGRMVGFHFLENFNYPYIAKSVTDFWRRWHMSLSSFFRDYVYIPLGGNRKFQIRNLLIVWTLTGLWHGASWNFVLWGLYYFVLLVIEKFFLGKTLAKQPSVLRHIYLLLAVIIGWVFFYYTDLSQAGGLLKAMFGLGTGGLTSAEFGITFSNNIFFVILAVMSCTPILKLIKAIYMRTEFRFGTTSALCLPIFKTIGLSALLIVCTIFLVGQSYNPFLYFRF